MKDYEIVVLIDCSGNVYFEKVPEDKLNIYLANKEAEGYLFSVVNNVEPTEDDELVFDIYDGECYGD